MRHIMLFIMLFTVALPTQAWQLRTKYHTTALEIRELAKALEQYHLDYQTFPAVQNEPPYGLQALVSEGYVTELKTDFFAKKQSADYVEYILEHLFSYILFFLGPCILIGITFWIIFSTFIKEYKLHLEYIIPLFIFAIFIMFLILTPWGLMYYTLFNHDYILLETIGRPKGIQYSYFYSITKDRSAIVASPGIDFEWQLDIKNITNLNMKDIILGDPTPGIQWAHVSATDQVCWQIPLNPKTQTIQE